MYHDYDMEKILEHLRTTKKKKVILDTDTFNEIDDQFAVTYALLSEDEIDLLALNAAPFTPSKSNDPSIGMEQSYEELLRIMKCMDPENKRGIPCYRGSRAYLKNAIMPEISEAAENISRIVREADDIVYITMIGCFTNVASALLLDPSIVDKAVIVMLGTQTFDCLSANDTNVGNDPIAARVIFDSGIPVIVLPVFGCTATVQASNSEILDYLENQSGEIGKLLCSNIYSHHGNPVKESDGTFFSTRHGLVDIASIAFLKDMDKMVDIETVPAHTVDSNGFWRCLDEDRNMLYVPRVNAELILSDMYTVLRNAAKK